MLDADTQHQRAAAAALRHLARGVAVALHERHDAGRRQGAVLHGAATGAYVAQVVPHAAATLHQLHLLLVNLHDAAVGVAVARIADDEAVRQRDHLEIVADTTHRTALRHNVAEVLQQLVDLLLAEGVGILLLDAGILRRQATVHHVRVQLIDLVVVAQGILVHPHIGGQLVAVEILHRRFHNLLRRVLPVLFGFLLGGSGRKQVSLRHLEK